MPQPAIQVERLSKCYQLGARQQARATLREAIMQTARAPWDRFRRLSGRDRSTPFWALDDVSFEILPGQVVGIIGRNGAGKSTLLRILSRITHPTGGRVTLRGRVSSLLEVGTGFHPELTGRENIYLNGAILGMRQTEIRRKFDAIVDFAEVEQFLDTQVKHYSSGMYMRLAFAVAAHLEPEILLVDEVLSVGDAAFQRKSLGKMNEVADSGRTVLFVSHNMNAIENFCSRAILLEKGWLREDGTDVREIVGRYLGCAEDQTITSAWQNKDNALDHPSMQPLFFAVVDQHGQPLASPVRNDEPCSVVIRANVRQLDPALNAGFALYNQDSELLLWSLSTDGPESRWPKLEPGIVEVRCSLPRRCLNEGTYRLELIASLHYRDWIARPGHNSPAVHFEIRGGLSDSPYWLFARPGILAPEWEWQRTV